MVKFKRGGIQGRKEAFEGGDAMVRRYPTLLIMFYVLGEVVGTRVCIIYSSLKFLNA